MPIIEDACQAIGATYKGRQAGSMGAAGCFSFFPSKNLGAFGDGGLVTTEDAALARAKCGGYGITVRRRSTTTERDRRQLPAGCAAGGGAAGEAAAPGAVDAPCAARTPARYRRLFAIAAAGAPVVLPVEAEGCFHIYNQFVVRVPDRDRVRAFLTEHGVGTEVYYPVPFHLQECFASLGYRRGDFPQPPNRPPASTIWLCQSTAS